MLREMKRTLSKESEGKEEKKYELKLLLLAIARMYAYSLEMANEALDERIGKLSTQQAADVDHFLAIVYHTADLGAHRNDRTQIRGKLRALVHLRHGENLDDVLDVLLVRVESPDDLLQADGQRLRLRQFFHVAVAVLHVIEKLHVFLNLLTIGSHLAGNTAHVFGHHLRLFDNLCFAIDEVHRRHLLGGKSRES